MLDEDYANQADGSRNARHWLQAAGISAATALFVAVPFLRLGNVIGHDFAFHLTSWMDVAQQWKQGIVFPRWAEWANGGFGEPRFLFYPPLSWTLGAALSLLAPWKDVPVVFIAVAQVLAGLSMYAVARRFLSQAGALLATVFYAANPYVLLDIYLRSAFAEELACALMPLVVLAALELSGLVERRRSKSQTAVFLALVFAAVWLSNVPAGVIATYSAALIFAWAALRRRSLQPLWYGATGLALGFGLAGFYFLPVLYEQRWINTAILLPAEYIPKKHFLYAQPYWETGLPKTVTFNWIVSSVAVLMKLVTAITAFATRPRSRGEGQDRDFRTVWRVLLLLGGAVAFILVPPSWILWKYLPKFAYVQFPWRWLSILALAYAFYLAATIEQRRHRWVWTAAGFVALAATATYIVHCGMWISKIDVTKGMHQEFIEEDGGFIGAAEYFPGGEDYHSWFTSHFPTSRPRVQVLPGETGEEPAKAQIQIEKWTAEERDLLVTSQEPVQVALRLLNYPAWQTEVNGKLTAPERSSPFNQMVLPVPRGQSAIRVKFKRTADRLAGSVLSVGSTFIVATILLTCWLRERKAVWHPGRQILERPAHNPGDSAAA